MGVDEFGYAPLAAALTTINQPGHSEADDLPLRDIRVLQFGAAAGYGGRLLAGFGAEVILIEPPVGCIERREPPFLPGPLTDRSSAVFSFFTPGARSVAIDAATIDGAEVLDRALAACDVYVDALDWELPSPWVDGCRDAISRSQTPGCHVGPAGPLAAIGADDYLIQAASGLMYISGFEDRAPMPAPTPLAKLQDGLFAAVSVLAMLLSPGDATIASQEALAITSIQTANPGFYTWKGEIPRRLGVLGLGGNPYQCADGFVIFTAPPERWPALRQWLDDEEIAAPGIPYRLDAGVESMRSTMIAARPLVERLAASRTKASFFHEAQRRGLICMPVNELMDVFRDAHLEARDFFIRSSDGGLELRDPFTTAPELWVHPGHVPGLGADTERFLAWLEYTREEIEILHGSGAIVCRH